MTASSRLRRLALFPAATLVALACAPVARASTGTPVAVIVEASSTARALDAVHKAGGRVTLELPLVNGVAATVDAGALSGMGDDVVVVPDVAMHATGMSYDARSVDTQVAALHPGDDLNPNAGKGVAVALVDTGVADTPDLKGADLVRGPDFSSEVDGLDHFGHGTFMAGLIAGDGSASANDAVHHVGVAPGATLVSVKVAGADGSTSLSRVIAGIGWSVVHRDQYGIGVISLSFGVDAPMPYVVNPLSGAVEAAWASGMTVVVAAGNEGSDGVTSPGDDPYVLTVGASDTAGTVATRDDTVPAWSGRQRLHGYSKPDVVAPGVSLTSLRAPGSTIDVTHPEGRVNHAYFRGTGTSMSTALVAGAAAVLLSHHPDATPDDVKGALVDTATRIGGGAAVNLDAAEDATPQRDWWQHYPVAFGGLGLGLRDGMPWSASRWTGDTWNASRWTGSRWTASRWTASRWTASRWTDQNWLATRWTASRWTDQDWAASRWTGSRWTDEDWAASRWTASRWTASRWTASSWPSQGWG